MPILSNLRKSIRVSASTVEDIHNEFDSAQERLLEEAKQIIADCEVKNHRIVIDTTVSEKADRLTKLGFTSTREVKKVQEVRAKKEENKKILVKTKEEADLIEMYKRDYPFQKFLTEDELHRICDKYNLIYAPVSAFIADVPEKNLREIENAKPLDSSYRPKNTTKAKFEIHYFDDKNYVTKEDTIGWENIVEVDGLNVSDSDIGQALKTKYNTRKWISLKSGSILTKIDRSGLFIAAPKSHFNLKNLNKDDKNKYGFFQTEVREIKDPIVFRYCKGGIQVLSKWGQEANDELLINAIDN